MKTMDYTVARNRLHSFVSSYFAMGISATDGVSLFNLPVDVLDLSLTTSRRGASDTTIDLHNIPRRDL